MTIRQLLTAWICCLFSTPLTAQPVCTVRTLNTSDGLHTNHITSLAQDRHGLMWMGTWNGLLCFDGFRFVTFQGGTDMQVPFSHQRIMLLEPCSQGGLWLVTYYGELYRFDDKTNQFVNISERLAQKGIKTHVRKISQTANGRTILHNHFEDGHRTYVILDDKTIEQKEIKAESRNTFPVMDLPRPNSKVASYSDSKGRRWHISSKGITMQEKGGKPNPVRILPADNNRYTTSKIPLFTEDRQHSLWMAAPNGYFCHYSEKEKLLVPYPLLSSVSNRPIPTITKSYTDHQGNLWCIGPNSFNILSFGYQYFHSETLEQHVETRAVCFDRSGGLWTGSNNGMMTQKGKRYNLNANAYCIHEDHKGRMWIGTKENGLFVRQKNGSVEHFTADGGKYSLPSNDIYDIDEDTQGRIWIGCYGGGLALMHEENGKTKFISSKNELRQYPTKKFPSIRRITHTKEGIMIVSTTTGLVTFSDNFTIPSAIRFHTHSNRTETGHLQNDDVLQTLVTQSGRIFMATMNGGFEEANSKTLLTKLTTRQIGNSLSATGMVQSLCEDNNGYIWIVCENLLQRYDPKRGDFAAFNYFGDETQTSFTEAKPTFNIKTGEIVVATLGGYVRFSPHEVSETKDKPSIVFPYLQFAGEMEYHPVLYTKCVEIPSDKRSLTFFFSALNYPGKGALRYAYKLEGVDKDWHYCEQVPSASYNNLPHGKLRLLVRSTDRNGTWTDNTTELNIYVHPTFWESWPAKILYILLAATMLFLVYRYLTARRRIQIEREMNKQKTKLYADASHRLRTPLTLIGGPVAEVLGDKDIGDHNHALLEMVQRNARRMLEMINDMLSVYYDNNYFVDDNNAPVFKEAVTGDRGIGQSANKQATSIEEDLVITMPTRLLVVEDNDDLREFLKSILCEEYSVITAANGKEGLEKAISNQPDFIITDVNMPMMDGLTMIHTLKQNKETSQIPIIVLSAKASLDDKLAGLKEGIDDYITKPFSAVYLKNRVANIISQRKQLQQSILNKISEEVTGVHDTNRLSPTTAQQTSDFRLNIPEVVDYDKLFMDKLMVYLKDHLCDSDLRVDDMASAVNLNRTSLFNKLKSLVGMSPNEFVKHLRMEQAIHLVTNTEKSFTDIAYAIGFADSRYFSKVFKKETGYTPSQYREMHVNKE